MYQIKFHEVRIVCFIKAESCILNHSAFITAKEHPISIDDGYPGTAIFTMETFAVAQIYTLVFNCVINMCPSNIVTEDSQKSTLMSQLF